MPQRRPYNPNTAYGLRKLREEAAENYRNISPREKSEANFKGFFILVVIAVIVFLIFYSAGDTKGFLKWISR